MESSQRLDHFARRKYEHFREKDWIAKIFCQLRFLVVALCSNPALAFWHNRYAKFDSLVFERLAPGQLSHNAFDDASATFVVTSIAFVRVCNGPFACFS
jgi:hypothetical protein